VVGILAEFDPDGIATVCDTLRTLPGSPRIAILRNDRSPAPADQETSAQGASLFFVPSNLAKLEGPDGPVLGMFAAYESIFAASDKLGARGCCVVASKLESGALQWVRQIAQPLLESDLDLLVPHYARHKFGGLLNRSIISPLVRSLYGKRIHSPMGPDLGVSQRLFRRMLETERSARAGDANPLASLTPMALCQNLNISELHVGARIYPPTEWSSVSSLLVQILGPIFADMERNAACWQRIRGSVSVPSIGDHAFVAHDGETPDTSGMLESFQLGNRELQEIWGLVLPPTTLFELRKLSRLPTEQFRMPDELWVRIVYDFALAHRLRTITRDHLLKSLAPLYLGWVASYVREVQLGGIAAGQPLERLALAYESNKPYLLSRWRWPDRFSP
jgi:hypothetical protein